MSLSYVSTFSYLIVSADGRRRLKSCSISNSEDEIRRRSCTDVECWTWSINNLMSQSNQLITSLSFSLYPSLSISISMSVFPSLSLSLFLSLFISLLSLSLSLSLSISLSPPRLVLSDLYGISRVLRACALSLVVDRVVDVPIVRPLPVTIRSLNEKEKWKSSTFFLENIVTSIFRHYRIFSSFL